MPAVSYPHWLLEQEGRALLTRLARVRPFALHEPMVLAAAASTAAQAAIENYLAEGRRELRTRVNRFLEWIRGPGQAVTAEDAQRRFTFIRLRFNAVLSHFDIFADVMTQRSETETGVWLAGLDTVASDALELDGDYFEAPPVICYLDRGHGAAIRRARTRLPGGGESPVAIVRVPRERMVGTGIASSLVHEVGHQGAALLELVNELRPVLLERAATSGRQAPAWRLWERWISEIIADFWSVGRVGVASTTGLIGVVSLPRAFVFRVNFDDPHPMPWIRARLSCAMGSALYPDPQWRRLAETWRQLYPVHEDLTPIQRRLIGLLEESMPEFVDLLLSFRPRLMRGDSLRASMRPHLRTPERLRETWRSSRGSFERLRAGAPSLLFAVLGQARADGELSPEGESRLLSDLLKYWALRDALETTEFAARRRRTRVALSPTG
jgi:hypothetical protein